MLIYETFLSYGLSKQHLASLELKHLTEADTFIPAEFVEADSVWSEPPHLKSDR